MEKVSNSPRRVTKRAIHTLFQTGMLKSGNIQLKTRACNFP